MDFLYSTLGLLREMKMRRKLLFSSLIIFYSFRASSDQIGRLSDAFKFKLIDGYSMTVKDADWGAERMKTRCFSDAKTWELKQMPGLLDAPAGVVFVRNNKVLPLETWQQISDWATEEMKAALPTLTSDQRTACAIDFLAIRYQGDEFTNSNFEQKPSVGYRVISKLSEISGFKGNSGPQVSKPQTIKSKELWLTTVWFWGAHNCELHKFVLTTSDRQIVKTDDTKEPGKFGVCRPIQHQ